MPDLVPQHAILPPKVLDMGLEAGDPGIGSCSWCYCPADSSSLTNTLRISCRDGVGGHVHQRGEHLVGCRKAKRLALLSRVAIASSSACENTDRSVPLGRYWRSRPLVFSLEPRCHGACGSAK